MNIRRIIKHGYYLLGVQSDSNGHIEKLLSVAGGFIGIVSVMMVSHEFLGVNGSSMIIASMGATSVLLFAAPHGAFSQPWAVLGGHILSAIVGVTCRLFIPDMYIAAALAVGISIGVMFYLRCLHPPGGATALVAVIGDEMVQSLGYQFVFTPVLINALILVSVAVTINLPFKVRRYPLALNHYMERKILPGREE